MLSAKLCKAALVRVAEIEIEFGHTRPNGQNSKDYIRQVMGGRGIAGENIAYNFPSASEVMYFQDTNPNLPEGEMTNGWMYTKDQNPKLGKHGDIIKNPSYDQVGIAYLESTHSWVAMFYSTTVLAG